MEVDVVLAPFGVYKDCVSGFWVCACGKFNQSGLKNLRALFNEKAEF